MPIRKVNGGYKWGSRGHVYKTRAGAARQARAAYAHGYRGGHGNPIKTVFLMPMHMVARLNGLRKKP